MFPSHSSFLLKLWFIRFLSLVTRTFFPYPNVTGKYKERECYSFHYILLAWGEKSKRPQHCCFTVHNTPFCKGQKLLLSVPLQVWISQQCFKKIYLKQLTSCWATLYCIVFQTWHQHATNYPFYRVCYVFFVAVNGTNTLRAEWESRRRNAVKSSFSFLAEQKCFW